jgi:esterase/lipase superfamily enzyme
MIGEDGMKSAAVRLIALAILASLIAGCGGKSPFEIDMMPAPDVYDAVDFNPLADSDPISEMPYSGMLFATDRMPAGEDDKERFFVNDRGDALLLGVANVDVADVDMTWEEARRVSLLKNRSTKYPLSVSDVEVYGALDRTLPSYFWRDELPDDSRAPGEKYAAAINAQLARSKEKNIYIYVHGYKVVFENPILVATELWHFLGYDGVFIAYAWPSTPSKWAYMKDTETAEGFARNLRLLLEFLAEETDAERIHVLGYSAGTRLVARAYEQIALQNQWRPAEEIRDDLRLGKLILVGSDIDRGVFGNYLSDGLLDVLDKLTVYVSGADKALGVSKMLTRRERLGEMFTVEQMAGDLDIYLRNNVDHLSVIDVSDAEGSTTGNGHGYFRNSPWASSDILMSMMYGLGPEERGLVPIEDTAIWTFPPDYIDRLREALTKVNPELSFDQSAEAEPEP